LRTIENNMPLTAEQHAESLIRATGARLTRPRMRVLTFLLEQARPLTHHDIQVQLPGEAIDVVTLYRVLEWLTETKIIHRIAGADHVWHFSAINGLKNGCTDHQHAHFQCMRCDSVTCFEEMALPTCETMPEGFTNQEVDFLIRGICPRCSQR
jgi:Fur family ferric uptake transcriptional regulator